MTKDKSLIPDGGNGLIYVGIPRERFLIPNFVDNRDMILGQIKDAGLGAGYYQAESHRVDRNRDAIVSQFLQHETCPEWLLMLDSDMEHPIDCALRLTAHRKPVIGGLYFHRGPSHDPVAFRKWEKRPDKWGRETQLWEPIRDQVYDFLIAYGVPRRDGAFTVGPPGRAEVLKKVDAVGTGCMLIHRSVLEAMQGPWFEYRDGSQSEDLEFCDRVKAELGLPVYVDLSTACGHYRQVAMGQTQFRMLHEGRGISATSYTPEEIAGTLAEYLKTDKAEELEKIKDYRPKMLADHWRKHLDSGWIESTPQADITTDFYRKEKTGRLYLYDLINWNASPVFKHFQRQLVKMRDKHVLEIGAGIGTVSMQLAIQQNDVKAFELNPVLRGFADRRWHTMQTMGRVGPVEFTDDVDGLPGMFDLVVAIDTFEHMAKSELQEWVDLIGNLLPVGGRLFCHNNWGQQNIFPMHIDNRHAFADALDRNGIFMLDELWGVKVK